MVGDEGKGAAATRELFEEGVLALAIVFPTVAKGKARIRTMAFGDAAQSRLGYALTVV